MSGRLNISRRQFGVGALLSGLFAKAYAQGFAGLGVDASGFAQVTPGRTFVFPADHGAHPEFRIEWWYVTANLTDAAGTAYGAQWTLFRQAMRASEQSMGWANPQAWMAHAAVTRADTHRFAEKFARGGIGQAGVTVTPFHAWIDSWTMLGLEGMDDIKLAPLRIEAAANDFSYSLQLDTTQKLVMQGDKGFAMPPMREIQDSGIMWGFGTDAFEVNQFRPFQTLYFAVTGKMVGGTVVNTHTVSREAALIAHTRSNAYLFFRENDLGSIQPGRFADLVVTDKDYLTVPADQIKDIKSVLTVVGGRIVYDATKDGGSTSTR